MDKLCQFVFFLAGFAISLSAITGPGPNVCTRQVQKPQGNMTITVTEYYCCKGFQEVDNAGSCTACTNNKFGTDCSQACACAVSNTEKCDHVTGACTCKDGYVGQTCNEKCDAWKFGTNCTKSCSCVQTNTQSCNHVSGSCTCKAGYIGNNCQSECTDGKYGANCASTCKCAADTTISCRHTDGYCDCAVGYNGSTCASKCPQGTYGKLCANSCSCSSTGTSSCDHVTGACTCKAGYIGAPCDQICPSMTYGQDCLQNCTCVEANIKKCQNTDGKCLCKAGFTGDRCHEVCPDRSFGDTCASQCSCPMNAFEVCDAVNGACVCKAGWTGSGCDIACQPGRFGSHCHGRCQGCDTCDVQTGECSSRNAGFIAAIIVLSVLLGILTVVFVFYIIRARRGLDAPLIGKKEKKPKLHIKNSTRSAGEPSPALYYNAVDKTYENTQTSAKNKGTNNAAYEPMSPEYENFTGTAIVEKDAPSEDKYESLQGQGVEHAYEAFNKADSDRQYTSLTKKK